MIRVHVSLDEKFLLNAQEYERLVVQRNTSVVCSVQTKKTISTMCPDAAVCSVQTREMKLVFRCLQKAHNKKQPACGFELAPIEKKTSIFIKPQAVCDQAMNSIFDGPGHSQNR